MAITGFSLHTIHGEDEDGVRHEFLTTGTTARVKLNPVFDEERRARLRDLVWVQLKQCGLTVRQIEAVCLDAARRRSQIHDRLKTIKVGPDARQYG